MSSSPSVATTTMRAPRALHSWILETTLSYVGLCVALLDEGFPVIAVATQSPTYDKVVSNIQECKARGARIVVVATEGDEDIKEQV